MKTLLLMLALIETPIAGFALVDTNAYWAQAEVIQKADDNPIIDKAINDYSLFYDIDPDLIRAVVEVESEGNIKAFNRNDNGTTDHGLMQINSFNHAWLREELGVTDFEDPVQNIQCGTYMMSLLCHKHSDLHKALMSYNMGERKTKELFAKGITSSAYSRKVIKKFNQIKEERR